MAHGPLTTKLINGGWNVFEHDGAFVRFTAEAGDGDELFLQTSNAGNSFHFGWVNSMGDSLSFLDITKEQVAGLPIPMKITRESMCHLGLGKPNYIHGD